MNMYDIIVKKRDGGRLEPEDIGYFIDGYTSGIIPDYQAAALLMAVYFNGLDKEETVELTRAMELSGDIVDLSDIPGIKVDKHSTGGVGDKTTLVVAPLAAACGVPIAKMSGRGLGFTGGTVDKLESIPGYSTSLEAETFMDMVKDKGIALIGQTGHIAPADKKIYALRDVTGTVENLSLITSSIMSKKLASGSDAILLDVKCGSGAFMESKEDAVKLGKSMVEIGNARGKRTCAVITDMNQPLGKAIGNSLEVIEAIETLKGKGPEDITELSVYLAGTMIYMGGKAVCPEEGRTKAREALKRGSGTEKLRDLIKGQGGDPGVIDDYTRFPQPDHFLELKAESDGKVMGIGTRDVGLASQHTGAGRATKDDILDLSAGIILEKKIGDTVKKGQILGTVYGNDIEKLKTAVLELKKSYDIGEGTVQREKLIKEVIGLS